MDWQEYDGMKVITALTDAADSLWYAKITLLVTVIGLLAVITILLEK